MTPLSWFPLVGCTYIRNTSYLKNVIIKSFNIFFFTTRLGVECSFLRQCKIRWKPRCWKVNGVHFIQDRLVLEPLSARALNGVSARALQRKWRVKQVRTFSGNTARLRDWSERVKGGEKSEGESGFGGVRCVWQVIWFFFHSSESRVWKFLRGLCVFNEKVGDGAAD